MYHKAQNKEVGEIVSVQKLEPCIKERRPRCFGHILQTDDGRRQKQTSHILGGEYYKLKAVNRQDLQKIGLS